MNKRDYALLKNKKKRSIQRVKQDEFKSRKTNKEFQDHHA